MRQIFPDLWQTSPEHPIPNAPDITSHAYLLVREKGNVLFYNTGREAVGRPNDDEDLSRIEDLGGVSHQFLGHWHEASPSLTRIRNRFGSDLGVHRDDAAAVERVGGGTTPDRLFDQHEFVLDDIEVIPTPGHTAGSVSFLYRSPHGRSYLFTGDAIVPWHNSWTAAPLRESDRDKLRESLALLETLEPDVVMAAAARAADTFQEVTVASWRKAIAAAERTLQRDAA